MNMNKLLFLTLFAASGLACAGTPSTEAPPPPPPPVPTTPDAAPPVIIPVPVATAPAVAEDPRLLPPPWGDLGFSYGNAVVLHVDPSTVVLTLPSGANAETEALYTAWEQKLVAAGFAAGVATSNGVDAAEPWTRGPHRISIARGIVGTSAYLYAEDLQKVAVSAVETRTVDDSVAKLIGLPTTPGTRVTPPKTGTVVTTPPTSTTPPDTTQGTGMPRGTKDAKEDRDGKPKGGKSGGKPKKGE